MMLCVANASIALSERRTCVPTVCPHLPTQPAHPPNRFTVCAGHMEVQLRRNYGTAAAAVASGAGTRSRAAASGVAAAAAAGAAAVAAPRGTRHFVI